MYTKVLSGVNDAVLRLDKQITDLKRFGASGALSPSVVQVGIEAAERERDSLLAVQQNRLNGKVSRAQKLAIELPDLMTTYRDQGTKCRAR